MQPQLYNYLKGKTIKIIIYNLLHNKTYMLILQNLLLFLEDLETHNLRENL